MVKVNVDPRLQNVYDEAMRILKDNQKELLRYSDYTCLSKAMKTIISVKINAKATSRRGCMKPRGSESCIIEISEYMLALPEKEIVTTMVHELLHTFKDSNGHTGEWLHRAKLLKEKTGLNIVRTRSIENEWTLRKEYNKQKMAERAEKSKAKTTRTRRKSNKQIVCRCTRCGVELTRTKETRFTINPQRYRHRGCGGHFERVGVRVEL